MMRMLLCCLVLVCAGCRESNSGPDASERYDQALYRYNAEVERYEKMQARAEKLPPGERRAKMDEEVSAQFRRVERAKSRLSDAEKFFERPH
jgi:hypothetical protein